MSETYYIRVAKRVLKVLERVDFPFYFSRFSKKTYTLRQHFVLLVIRQVEGKSYYSFAESLKDLNRLTDFLGLKKLPDGGTLQKAAQRIGNAWLDKLLLKFVGNRSNLQVGIDSTGFELQQASDHYLDRVQHQTKEEKKTRMRGRPQKSKFKNFQHTTFVSDVTRQLILAS